MRGFIAQRRDTIITWYPAALSGLVAWLVFVQVGDTPLIRATGLAFAVMGVAMALRSWGAILAVIGSLVLAFGPAFWAQTGGGASLGPATITLGLAAAFAVAVIAIVLSNRPYLAIGLGLLVFAVVFWSQIGTPRSLRLTGLLTAWMMFLLVDAIRKSNPRPDETPTGGVEPQHYVGLTLLLAVGVLNDPLFVLMLPAVVLGLWLSRTPLPGWYWLIFAVLAVFGVRGVIITYIDPAWWDYPAVQAQEIGLQMPVLLPGGLQAGERWVNLIELVVRQFTLPGALLSVVGLARMARWYPSLGVVTMIGYGCYTAFGLAYFGADREILLLPLFIIQTIWLTYAVHTFGTWLSKSVQSRRDNVYRLAVAAYILLPFYLFISVAIS